MYFFVISFSFIIKQILAGAQTVQVCSVLYKKGIDTLQSIINNINEWMDSKNYKTLDEDKSKGVHNPKYVEALLKNSIEAIQN